jgi:hypothetical protein
VCLQDRHVAKHVAKQPVCHAACRYGIGLLAVVLLYNMHVLN